MRGIISIKNAAILCLAGIMCIHSGCKKNSDNPGGGGGGGSAPSAPNPHLMNDPRLVGEWKNVSVSDFNWETDYGVNAGPQNGSYIDYIVNSDGSGSCVKYVSTSEPGSTYSIFQRSSGFFIANKNGDPRGYFELTYCPTQGIIELTKNGVTTKTTMSGKQLYQENDPSSGRDFFPSYDVLRVVVGSYTDPHHYIYCTYTDKDGKVVTDASGKEKVTSYVDVVPGLN